MYQQVTNSLKVMRIFLLLIVASLISCDNKPTSTKQKKEKQEWSEAMKYGMTTACIGDTDGDKDNLALRKKMCECLTEKTALRYAVDEMTEINKKSKQEQLQILKPIIDSCLKNTSSK